MVGGRRRKNNNSNSNSNSSALQSVPPVTNTNNKEDKLFTTEQQPQPSHHNQLGDLDDPFAYDSDLETLSSVSSHSSIANSSDEDVLDKPPTAANPTTNGVVPAVDTPSPPTANNNYRKRSFSEMEEDNATETSHKRRLSFPSPSSDKDKLSGTTATVIAANIPAHTENNKASSPSGSESSKETHPVSPSAIKQESENNNGNSLSSEAEEEEDEDVVANEARRTEALLELTNIEIEFAKLRERLYCERLQQVQIEEQYLVSGHHPEYERHVEELTASHNAQMERMQYAHNLWLKQRQRQHETWQKTLDHTYLVKRQELRSQLLEAQRKRMWRLRDARVQEDQRRQAENSSAMRISYITNGSIVGDDLAAIAQQHQANIEHVKRVKRAATTTQRCMVHRRKQRLCPPGIDPKEMDEDYQGLGIPVQRREPTTGFRNIYVPPLLPEGEPAMVGSTTNEKKRKARQPKQPKQPKKKRQQQKQENNENNSRGGRGGGQQQQQQRKNNSTVKVTSTTPTTKGGTNNSNNNNNGGNRPHVNGQQQRLSASSASVLGVSSSQAAATAKDNHSGGSVDMHLPPAQGSGGAALGLRV